MENRFHGLFGEPRDAFAILALGLALYFLRSFYFSKAINVVYIIVIVSCMALTYSVSGVIGLLLFPLILLLVNPSFFYRNRLLVLISIGLIVTVVFAMFELHVRMEKLYSSLIALDLIGTELIYDKTMTNQLSNIFPFVWSITNFMNGNIVPVLFGGGFGASAIVNNIYNAEYGIWLSVGNAHSNLSRLITEVGIIGLLIYICSLYYPARRMLSYIAKGRNINYTLHLFVVVISVTLAHRSYGSLIVFGLIFAMYLATRDSDAGNYSST